MAARSRAAHQTPASTNEPTAAAAKTRLDLDNANGVMGAFVDLSDLLKDCAVTNRSAGTFASALPIAASRDRDTVGRSRRADGTGSDNVFAAIT